MKDTLLGNRYVVLEPIGSGGEARVFHAQDTKTGHHVAVRLAHRAGHYAMPHSLPVFHPGWVQLLDWGEDPKYGAYHVFELLAGQTLEQLLRFGPFAPENWLRFVNQSLEPVMALHDAGWIHGDLNAGNLFQTVTGWKLLELPFLRFDPPAGRSALFGSIYTLTPEQLNGSPTDARSDLYALGCLYYYAASGEFPHAGGSSQDIAINRLRFAAEPLEAKAPRLPVDWSAWVMTLLEREPQNRFPTALAARQLLKVA